MLARRRLASGICAAAALLPAVLWLLPALTARMAPSYRDQGDFFYPLKLYTAGRLASGEIPLWNPLSGAGEPWLANGQSGVFYPPTLLFLLPSVALAGALFLLLHFAIAAWGARRFLKEENVSDSGALAGAAAFAASGFAASFAAYWNHFGAWAYLPAIASLARSGLRSRASVLGFGTLLGLQAMAGSPEMSAATIAMAAALALFPREPFPEPPAPEPRWRGLRRCGAGIGLGLLLAAWVLVPMAELALHSDRREPLPSAERSLGAASGRDLLSLAGFTPAWSGNAYLATVFLPPFALVTAAAAFRERHRRRLALLLLAFALFGVLAAMQAPPGAWLRDLPFFDRVRYPAKWLAFTSFGLAMLAGMGLDSLRFQTGEGRIRSVFGALATAALALAALSPLPLPVRLSCGIGSAAVGLLALGAGRARPAGTLLAGTAAAALAVALALELSPVTRFAPESAISRCPEPVVALSRTAGRIVTPPMSALAGWVLRDGQFDGPMLARQREALLGYTNLPCRVPSVRTAAAMRTAAAERIEDSIGAAVRRMMLFTPSAATTRSGGCPPPSVSRAARSATSTLKWSSTPRSVARRCSIPSNFFRAMPLKPWPPDVIVTPLKWTSMSSQWAKLSVMAR